MFKGFKKDTFQFLRELGKNNNKVWFECHRNQYLDCLVTPLVDLVGALGSFMLLIDDAFEIRPAIGKTISRIHGDVRFSPKKELYRTRMWITFKHPRKNWQDAPAYFFEISPNEYRYGMGFYRARPNTMQAVRLEIKRNPKRFASKLKGLGDFFEIKGDLYKRKLDCDTLPSEVLPFYQRKSFYLVRLGNIDDLVLSPKLIIILMEKYKLLEPLYIYLKKIKEELDLLRCSEDLLSSG